MTRDSFISRWSRLKGEATRDKAEAPAPHTATPPATRPVPSPSQPSLAPPDPARPPLSPEEIAALPPVESLTPLSDITPFLRKGVPALLRNAALRRMWSLNPAIRDYVDDAMEYAMDWNTPGAILGNGPLAAGDDPLTMARRLMDGAARAAPAPETAPETAQEIAPEIAANTPADAPEEPPKEAPSRGAGSSSETGADASRAAAAPERGRRRRHGGAAPM